MAEGPKGSESELFYFTQTLPSAGLNGYCDQDSAPHIEKKGIKKLYHATAEALFNQFNIKHYFGQKSEVIFFF